jgi:MOSC domain-containing protein YiiM
MARLLSINAGLPRDIVWRGMTVHTGVWKDPVQGRRRVGKLNLDGDGQGDLAGYGGEWRAVFVYQIESCRYWRRSPRQCVGGARKSQESQPKTAGRFGPSG